jgi:hypothetical protein
VVLRANPLERERSATVRALARELDVDDLVDRGRDGAPGPSPVAGARLAPRGVGTGLGGALGERGGLALARAPGGLELALEAGHLVGELLGLLL